MILDLRIQAVVVLEARDLVVLQVARDGIVLLSVDRLGFALGHI